MLHIKTSLFSWEQVRADDMGSPLWSQHNRWVICRKGNACITPCSTPHWCNRLFSHKELCINYYITIKQPGVRSGRDERGEGGCVTVVFFRLSFHPTTSDGYSSEDSFFTLTSAVVYQPRGRPLSQREGTPVVPRILCFNGKGFSCSISNTRVV